MLGSFGHLGPYDEHCEWYLGCFMVVVGVGMVYAPSAHFSGPKSARKWPQIAHLNGISYIFFDIKAVRTFRDLIFMKNGFFFHSISLESGEASSWRGQTSSETF